ncbi:hypothetical protein NV379_12015 [Paenibacillus sp. N1-5-1-14]|nr:hypothetical protein [Paenibacillus radicibacter]MCR8643377.1 hypothetical protein [Paenibacillus radicibacter]
MSVVIGAPPGSMGLGISMKSYHVSSAGDPAGPVAPCGPAGP